MPSFMSIRALRAVAPMLAAVALSGCGGSGASFAPVCPSTGILKDGADVTRFRGNGQDLTDMVVDGRITGLSGKCSLDDDAHLRTTIAVNMEVGRGPANQTRNAVLNYFVSVLKGRTILDKKNYAIEIAFQENSDHVQLSGEPVQIVLPVDAKTSGAAYRIEVSYQLSPQELAFNRRRGPR